MTLVSLKTLIFFIIVLGIYYVVARNRQWVILLLASLSFFVLSAPPYTLVYLLISAVTVFFAAKQIEKGGKASKAVYCGTVIINAGILVVLKYINFLLGNIGSLIGAFGFGIEIPVLKLAASLGVSFYTLQLIGYLTNVYWGLCKCQHNFAKLLLFSCYYPQMISGPISRYEQIGQELYSGHAFNLDRVRQGCFRILLGIFKKMVISEQLIAVTEALLGDGTTYTGVFLILGMGLYVLRIYADFAGCMDIVLGASQCFGICLPENFKNPFASKSIQEFWQRWHITLGTWLKDYIMYPILRTKVFGRFTKFTKAKLGKQASKQIPTYLAMLVLWLCMGIWHGGGWNFIAEGLWFWLVIVLGQVFYKPLDKLSKILRINTDTRLWKCWQQFRTAVIFAIGILFFRSNSIGAALSILKNALDLREIVNSIHMIPSVLQTLDGTVGTMKIIWVAASVIVGILGLWLFSLVEKKDITVAAYWDGKGVFIKYAIVYILLFVIVIFGAYGPGYASTEFIYGGF